MPHVDHDVGQLVQHETLQQVSHDVSQIVVHGTSQIVSHDIGQLATGESDSQPALVVTQMYQGLDEMFEGDSAMEQS